MADEAARRREIRRRRILENAEERKKKIFGTAADSNGGPPEENEKSDAPGTQDTNQDLSKHSSVDGNEGNVNNVPYMPTRDPATVQGLKSEEVQQAGRYDGGEDCDDIVEPTPRPPIRAANGIGSVPDIADHIRNINDLLNAGGSAGFSPTQTRKSNNDVQSAPSVAGAFSTPVVPIILALFVCILLSVNLGYVVSNSIALPFLLWEVHHLWCQRHIIESVSRGMGGLLGLALVLCGVHQSLISKMAQVMTVIKCVFEDFAFYTLTVVIWYCVLGLPGNAHVVNEYPPEPVMAGVTAVGEEEDLFGNMEDF